MDDGTVGAWRTRPCGSCGHKARSHIGSGNYCVAFTEGALFNACHCEAFVETWPAESLTR